MRLTQWAPIFNEEVRLTQWTPIYRYTELGREADPVDPYIQSEEDPVGSYIQIY